VDRAAELARAAADLAERDDLWFARAQWLVRRALLARAAELGIDADDVCWLPVDEVAGATELDVDQARRRAAAARAAAERAARWAMPVVVEAEAGERAPAGDRVGAGDAPGARAATVLCGSGSGGRATGRVVRFASLAAAVAVGAGDVVVARAITPALAVFVVGCAAIVSESGGPLDHGAALARELGIPCVVGCGEAWTRLVDGQVVTVDGDEGTVTIYDSSSS
jgi:pyruvate,water dikinase